MLTLQNSQGQAHRLDAHALGQGEDDGNEQGEGHGPLQFSFEHTGKERRQDAAGDIAQQPRESAAEGDQRRGLLRFGQMHADELKEDVVALAPVEFAQFGRVQLHVHHADDVPVLVHDRERQEPVQGEEFASLQHRRLSADGDDFPHHDVGHLLVQRIEQQPTGRDDSLQGDCRHPRHRSRSPAPQVAAWRIASSACSTV